MPLGATRCAGGTLRVAGHCAAAGGVVVGLLITDDGGEGVLLAYFRF